MNANRGGSYAARSCGAGLESERGFGVQVAALPSEGKEAPGRGLGDTAGWLPHRQPATHELCRSAFFLHSIDMVLFR